MKHFIIVLCVFCLVLVGTVCSLQKQPDGTTVITSEKKNPLEDKEISQEKVSGEMAKKKTQALKYVLLCQFDCPEDIPLQVLIYEKRVENRTANYLERKILEEELGCFDVCWYTKQDIETVFRNLTGREVSPEQWICVLQDPFYRVEYDETRSRFYSCAPRFSMPDIKVIDWKEDNEYIMVSYRFVNRNGEECTLYCNGTFFNGGTVLFDGEYNVRGNRHNIVLSMPSAAYENDLVEGNFVKLQPSKAIMKRVSSDIQYFLAQEFYSPKEIDLSVLYQTIPRGVLEGSPEHNKSIHSDKVDKNWNYLVYASKEELQEWFYCNTGQYISEHQYDTISSFWLNDVQMYCCTQKVILPSIWVCDGWYGKDGELVICYMLYDQIDSDLCPSAYCGIAELRRMGSDWKIYKNSLVD